MTESDEGLTTRQQQVYDFIRALICERGYGPTVREIGLKFGIRSPNGVVCHLKALEKKGKIFRDWNKSRAIGLPDLPNQKSLAYLGDICAGESPSLRRDGTRLEFDGLFQGPDLFCVRIVGEPPAAEGIVSGDLLIVRKQPSFQDGDLAIVVYEDATTDLRRVYRKITSIRLASSNGVDPDRLENRIIVIGVVIANIRLSDSHSALGSIPCTKAWPIHRFPL